MSVVFRSGAGIICHEECSMARQILFDHGCKLTSDAGVGAMNLLEINQFGSFAGDCLGRVAARDELVSRRIEVIEIFSIDNADVAGARRGSKWSRPTLAAERRNCRGEVFGLDLNGRNMSENDARELYGATLQARKTRHEDN